MERRRALAILSAASVLPAFAAFAGGHGRIAMFAGINGHTCSGTAEVVGNVIHLLDDFSFDGGPDARIAMGIDGVYAPETLTTLLTANSGSSSYTLPDGIDPGAYNEIWIWCEQFSVGLAVAKF